MIIRREQEAGRLTGLFLVLVQTTVPQESSISNGYKMDKVRWCVTSTQEHKKCENLKSMVSKFLCVLRNDTAACINAIKVKLTSPTTYSAAVS